MNTKYHGNNYSLQDLRSVTHTTRGGSSLLGLSEAAELIEFKTLGVKVSYQKLKEEVPFPCIANWNQIYSIKKIRNLFNSILS